MTQDTNENLVGEYDGRKILNVTSSGVSVGLESSQQKALGESAEIDAEIKRLKLAAIRRGIGGFGLTAPGPVTR